MSTETSTRTPAASAEERALTAQLVEQAEFQLQQLRGQAQQQAESGGTLEALSNAQLREAGFEPIVSPTTQVRNPAFDSITNQIAGLEAAQSAASATSLAALKANEQDLDPDLRSRPAPAPVAAVDNSAQIAQLRSQLTTTPEFVTQGGEVTGFNRLPPSEQEQQGADIQAEVLDLLIEDLRNGGEASREQIRLIDEATEAALASGETDIERFRTESLEALREKLAPALGLRGSDTPIVDRGARVAAEATRQSGQLSSSLRAANAQARLTLPLETTRITSAAGLGLSNLTEATRQFQESLRQQAFVNRLNLSGQSGSLGLGLAGNPGATISAALQPLTQSRLTNTTTTSSGGLGTLVGGIGAAGGLLSGLGAVGIGL